MHVSRKGGVALVGRLLEWKAMRVVSRTVNPLAKGVYYKTYKWLYSVVHVSVKCVGT